MRKKAQSLIEYAVLISAIVAALVCMMVYMKRGIQGRMRAVAGKLTAEESYPYNKSKLQPDMFLEKETLGLQEEDVDLGQGKGLTGHGFAYSRGSTQSSYYRTTQIEESASSQGQKITTTNATGINSMRQEMIR